MEIDYSDEIIHIQQMGMQCWVRSSEMLFTWVLHQLGLSPDMVYKLFVEDLLPEELLNKSDDREKLILEINQRILGRRLRKGEEAELCLDSLFVKVYYEFGASTFSPEPL